ncbi:hypothetical protein V2J09_014869 [Rumex salicifolius]
MDRNVLVAREYGRSSVLASMDSVVCPKPRRVGRHFRPPLGRHSYHTDSRDLKAGAELLDIIAEQGCCAFGRFDNQVSSPPFFCGSPPSRVSNPIVQDEHFTIGRFSPISPVPASPTSSSSSSARKGGCVPVKFGQKPAVVRIEGFNCLAQDTQNSSIFAVA